MGPAAAHIDGAFPKMFIDEIEQADVLRWFVGVSNRRGPGAGNACLEIVRAMFNEAEAWGIRAENTNPCIGIRMKRRRKCERFLSHAELAQLGAVLNVARQTQPQHATAILILLLTGCRLSEILTLKWSEIKGRRLLLPDSKTGPRTVWMGAKVRSLLDALPRHRDRAEVFWDHARDKPLSLAHIWTQLRVEAGLRGGGAAGPRFLKCYDWPGLGSLPSRVAAGPRFLKCYDPDRAERSDRRGCSWTAISEML